MHWPFSLKGVLMTKKIINLLLIVVLFCTIGLLLWKNTPISAGYYFNKGKQYYSVNDYKKASEMFEQATNVSPNNESYMYFYVDSLTKLEPEYSVQEKLFKLANSNIPDTAKRLAKSHIAILKKKLLEGFDDNYIYNALSTKEIIHWNIEDFPIKVYIQDDTDIPKYYVDNIVSALNEWEKRTGFIKFEQVKKESDSNISIIFREIPKSDCGVGGCQFMVATTEHNATGSDKLEKMIITFYKTNPFGDNFTENEINYTALHELGHALGIMGHSDDKTDIMYSNNQKIYDAFSPYRPKLLNISLRDLKTIALLYKIYPTMTNSKIVNKEKYLYAPLILGADDSLLRNKLQEFKRYIKQYPNISTGYINLSSIYAQLGENEQALDELNTAYNLSASDDEEFLIEFNRAMIYFNMQKFSEAEKHANEALSIREDSNLRELLKEINRINSEIK